MVLTASITDLDGRRHPMIGAVPGRAQMAGRLTMGYRQVTAARDLILARQGEQFRGHEFHYSDWLDRPVDLPHAYTIASRTDEGVHHEGYSRGNLLASYIHVHFASRPELARRFVSACAGWNDEHKL
jgi:cobyrinic acid a,c-diamide synthase